MGGTLQQLPPYLQRGMRGEAHDTTVAESLMCCLLECSNRQLQIFLLSRKDKLNQPSLTPNIIEKNDNYLSMCKTKC